MKLRLPILIILLAPLLSWGDPGAPGATHYPHCSQFGNSFPGDRGGPIFDLKAFEHNVFLKTSLNNKLNTGSEVISEPGESWQGPTKYYLVGKLYTQANGGCNELQNSMRNSAKLGKARRLHYRPLEQLSFSDVLRTGTH